MAKGIESIVTENGGLAVEIPAREITWFEFLQFSRATNSLFGGWNSQSHWEERGLLRLAANKGAFLQKWTHNSLQGDPQPRQGFFRLDRSISAARAASGRDRADCEIAINYGLAQSQKNILGYEIPLCEESSGQLKIDLLQRTSPPPGLRILELKCATGENPLMGLVEGICYAIQAVRCKTQLIEEARGRLDSQDFEFIAIVIAAPAQYFATYEFNSAHHRPKMERIVSAVGEELGIQLSLEILQVTGANAADYALAPYDK